MAQRQPLAPSLLYVETDLPPDMTIAEYRAQRALLTRGRGRVPWLRRRRRRESIMSLVSARSPWR